MLNFCVYLCDGRCDVCGYSTSDHNTLRRHRMRHTGQKPYRCAFCSYTAIQAISLKMHMRTKHPTAATTSTEAVPGATMVYSCQSCRYQTVNRRSWLDHYQDHLSNPAPATGVDATTSSEQLFVIEKQNGGQLVLAPLVHITQAVTANSNPNPLIVNPASNSISDAVVEGSQPDPADEHGLRHILTAISEQQQCSTIQ